MFEFLVLFLTFDALILLILISVSTPVVTQFYFLHTSQAGGVSFGQWGWCLDEQTQYGTKCSSSRLGIDWQPELTPWLTRVLVLFPIAAGFTFLALLSSLPPLCSRHRERLFPSPLFAFLAFLSFAASTLGLTFSLILFVRALERFHDQGFEADLGNCTWMAVAAAAALAIVSMSTGCGCTGARGRFTRASPYLAYNV